MVLKIRHFGKHIRNTLKVLKRGAGEEWRSVRLIVWKMKYCKESKRNIVHKIKKEGRLIGLVTILARTAF